MARHAFSPPAAAAGPTAVASAASPVAAAIPASMPDAWVHQVRSAVKAEQQSATIALLASSLLAAAIGAGSSLYVTRMNIGATERQEAERLQRQVQAADDASARTVYDELDGQLGELYREVDGLAGLIKIARANNSFASSATAEKLQGKLLPLGMTAKTIAGLKDSPQLDQQVSDQIDQAIRELSDAMHPETPDPEYEQFTRAVAPIEAALKDARRKVKTARANVGRSR